MSLPIIICDIDGVVADCTQRLTHINGDSKNWDMFFAACVDDAPIKNTIRFLQHLTGYCDIVYITGRPERVRKATVAWFDQHRVPFIESLTVLLMRADGDHRLDHVIKKELFRQFIDQTRVIAVIEDRDQVVQMWRDEGLLCLQPKKGDY